MNTDSFIVKNISLIAGVSRHPVPFLRGHDMDYCGAIADAWLLVTDGTFTDWGSMSSLPTLPGNLPVVDARGGLVIPSFADSHTHLVFPAPRHGEFLDKINGLSYEEIAARGGGILNSADTLASMSEQQLYDLSLQRLHDVISTGTGAIEIKSGYGLSLDSELKMLRVIARLAESSPAVVRATFLGAHAVGRAFNGDIDAYTDHLVRHMIPAVHAEGLADFIDVFCDRGFFTPEHTARIIEAGARAGMRAKIHGNELADSGGVEVAVAHNALSVDHLECAGRPQLTLLGHSDTVATMLPQASFFLGMPYGDARNAIDNNCILALASDFNPGSAPSGSMPFVMSLACIKMRLTPEQALNAITINGAYAMGLSHRCGVIAPGRRADFILTHPIPNNSNNNTIASTSPLAYLPYAFTTPYIRTHFLAGKKITSMNTPKTQ